MPAVKNPDLANGKATEKNRSSGPAPAVAAASNGPLPMATKVFCKGCTTNGSEYNTDAATNPPKLNGKVPMPSHWVNLPIGPAGPISTNK